MTPEQRTQIQTIDALLPQTQCGLCHFGGCKPYAEALVLNQAPIDRCPPGGIETLKQIGSLLQQDITPYLDSMRARAKPAQVAIINEDVCIGCKKCIQACPVDAIVGASKWMHTVITDECSGCALCVAPCPVDCIELVDIPNSEVKKQRTRAMHYRQRYESRKLRLHRQAMHASKQYHTAKHNHANREATLKARREAIKAAVKRSKQRKQEV